jgi:hypothetical protein
MSTARNTKNEKIARGAWLLHEMIEEVKTLTFFSFAH